MSNWKIKQAVTTLNSGGVIAYPTEAVYGLGCDPWDPQAVQRILTIKQRPWQKGLILIASDFTQLQSFINVVPSAILKRLENSWPGSTTWLLPASNDTPFYLRGTHDTLAVRVTAHPQTVKLCREFGGAIVSTSANRMGYRPARTVQQVHLHLTDIDYVLSGFCSGSNKPSMIKNVQTGERIR